MTRLDGAIMADRKENGQFAPGHKGGPGRPRRRTEDQYLDATIGRVTLKDWREIVDKAIWQAKKGDSRARQWLSDYLIGPPVRSIDITSKGERITGYAAVTPDDWDKGSDASDTGV